MGNITKISISAEVGEAIGSVLPEVHLRVTAGVCPRLIGWVRIGTLRVSYLC